MKGYFIDRSAATLASNGECPCTASTSRSAQTTRDTQFDMGCTEECAVPVMAYVPVQTFCQMYDPCEGIQKGTMFSQLYKPFMGKGCSRCGR